MDSRMHSSPHTVTHKHTYVLAHRYWICLVFTKNKDFFLRCFLSLLLSCQCDSKASPKDVSLPLVAVCARRLWRGSQMGTEGEVGRKRDGALEWGRTMGEREEWMEETRAMKVEKVKRWGVKGKVGRGKQLAKGVRWEEKGVERRTGEEDSEENKRWDGKISE